MADHGSQHPLPPPPGGQGSQQQQQQLQHQYRGENPNQQYQQQQQEPSYQHQQSTSPPPPPPSHQQQQQWHQQQSQPQASQPIATTPAQQQQYQQQQQQQQRQQQQHRPGQHSQDKKPRPRSRGLSFGSNGGKSHRSNGSIGDAHVDTDKGKRIQSKADPTMAMNEAEPSAIAANAEQSMASIRDMQHLDSNGQPLATPDLSNPTRHRFERPLETIRKFEADVDNGYNNRRSMVRSDTNSVATWDADKRSSFFGGSGGGYPGRYSRESYYGINANNGSRPPSSFNPQNSNWDSRSTPGTSSGYYNYGPGSRGGYGRGGRHPRSISDGHVQHYRNRPPYGNHPSNGVGPSNVYGSPQGQPSYETVGSGGSGSNTIGEPAGYQTDPTSSDNSSIERRHSPPKRRSAPPVNDYGIGFSQPGDYRPSQLGMNGGGGVSNTNGGGGQQSQQQTQQYQNGGGYQSGAPLETAYEGVEATGQSSAVPRTGGLGKDSGFAPTPPQPVAAVSRAPSVKRKSWFKRLSRAD